MKHLKGWQSHGTWRAPARVDGACGQRSPLPSRQEKDKPLQLLSRKVAALPGQGRHQGRGHRAQGSCTGRGGPPSLGPALAVTAPNRPPRPTHCNGNTGAALRNAWAQPCRARHGRGRRRQAVSGTRISEKSRAASVSCSRPHPRPQLTLPTADTCPLLILGARKQSRGVSEGSGGGPSCLLSSRGLPGPSALPGL